YAAEQTVAAAEGAQVDHSARRRPEERMNPKPVASGARADDMPACIHRCSPRTAAEGEGTEVDHPARRRPRERAGVASSNSAIADDLAAVVHSASETVRAPEGAEVDHPALSRPRERVAFNIARGVAFT